MATSKYADRDKLANAVANAECIADVMKSFDAYFGRNTGSGGYREVKKYIAKFELDTSHFADTKKKFGRGGRIKAFKLEDILAGKHPHYASYKLKRRLIEAGLKEDICEGCGQLPEWNGKPLALQLNHINGINTDNRLENLEVLCPNCHTQTDTYGSKRGHK